MTSATHVEGAEPRSFVQRHYHLLRRLHSFSGIAPIGLFLFPHLTTNSSIVWGRLGASHHGDAGVETFQHEVNFIHSLPALLLIEVFGLWLPIAFHAIVGIWFARSGVSNLRRYGWHDNLRYTLQRTTGYVGVVFIFMHLSSLRWGWTYGGLMPTFVPEHAASSTAAHLQHGTIGLGLALLYLVCVLALVFHFANGLWTAAITWGLTVTAGAQRRWGYVCAAVGAGLAAAGVAAVLGFSRLDIGEAREVELRMLSPETNDAATTIDVKAPGATLRPERE